MYKVCVSELKIYGVRYDVSPTLEEKKNENYKNV